jgi:arylsulfatase A-like enzyme
MARAVSLLALALLAGTAHAGEPKGSAAAIWRALDALGGAELEAPRLFAAYRTLLASGVFFNRNPYARHAPPRDRLDLYVTRLADVAKRAYALRRALYLPPPAKLRFRVKAPPGARLRFALARSGGPVTVRVRAGSAVIFEQRAPQLGWSEAAIALPSPTEEVLLSFETEGSGHAFLADPAIFAEQRSLPNVLVLLVDTLATWAVGCYGQKLPVTPHLDRLCTQGTKFENAIANANWTRPSTVSMLSSWLPGKVGISYNQFFGLDIAPERSGFYARSPDLVPALLRGAGYRTAALVNNLFLQGYHRYGVDVGFEEVVDYRRHVEDTVDISDHAIRFLEEHRDERFFLLLNYNAPHVEYVPPARYASEVRRMGRTPTPQTAAYLGEVRYTDEEVGRVLAALERLGLAERTLVVLTADHGEVHDRPHGYRVVRTGRYSRFGHAVTMYDEEVKVPMVLRQPGVIPAGKRIEAQVRLLDLAPTLLEHAGLSPSPKHQGKSFLNLVRGEAEPAERVAFIEGRMMRAVRAGGYKYFWRLPGYEAIAREGGTVRVPEELYELTRDPRERVNIVKDPAQAPRIAELRALGKKIQEHDAVAAAPGAAPALPPGAAVSDGPVSGVARVFLRFVGDGKRRRYEGRLRVPGGVRHFRLERPAEMDAIWRDDDGSLRFRVEVAKGPGTLWAEVAATGSMDLELSTDGHAGGPLRVGPFGLPLVDAGHIAGDDLALLDAAAPPPTSAGREEGVFLWRQRTAGAAEAAPSAEAEERGGRGGKAEREVEKMLQDWGYIQGGKKQH